MKRVHVIIDLREQKVSNCALLSSALFLEHTKLLCILLFDKFKNLIASVSVWLALRGRSRSMTWCCAITVCQSSEIAPCYDPKLIISVSRHDHHCVCVSLIVWAGECVQITRLCLFDLVQESASLWLSVWAILKPGPKNCEPWFSIMSSV